MSRRESVSTRERELALAGYTVLIERAINAIEPWLQKTRANSIYDVDTSLLKQFTDSLRKQSHRIAALMTDGVDTTQGRPWISGVSTCQGQNNNELLVTFTGTIVSADGSEFIAELKPWSGTSVVHDQSLLRRKKPSSSAEDMTSEQAAVGSEDLQEEGYAYDL